MYLAMLLGNLCNSHAQNQFGPPELFANLDVLDNRAQIADLNNDGLKDLLTVSQFIYAFVNQGDGTFEEILLAEDNQIRDIIVEDFEDDGDLDVIYHGANEVIALSLNQYIESGGVSNQFLDPMVLLENVKTNGLLGGDFNNDGLSDIVIDDRIQFEPTYDLKIYLRSNEVFAEPQIIMSGLWAILDWEVGDIDSDLDADILILEDSTSEIYWLENSSELSFSVNTIEANDAQSSSQILLIDLDNDSDLDIVSAGGENLVSYENVLSGQSFIQQTINSEVLLSDFLGSGDFNNDGLEDLFTGGHVNEIFQMSTYLVWFANLNGSAFDGPRNVSAPIPFIQGACALDVDSDGDLDLFGGSTVDGQVIFHENRSELNVASFEIAGCPFPEFVNTSVTNFSSVDLLWDFGDGNFSSEVNPSHIYEEPGDYTISLELCDEFDCDLFYQDFSVEKFATVNIPEEGLVSQDIVFSLNPTNINNVTWFFSDDEVYDQSEFTRSFDETGVYEIEIYLTDEMQSNCTSIIKEEIHIVTTFSDVEDVRESDLKIYPNPTKTFVQLELGREPSTVFIYNNQGRLVHFEEGLRHKCLLNTVQYTAGTYFVLVRTRDDLVQTGKFLKIEDK